MFMHILHGFTSADVPTIKAVLLHESLYEWGHSSGTGTDQGNRACAQTQKQTANM